MNKSQPSLGDRYAEISVVLLTALALLAGWLLMNNVQNRSLPLEVDNIKFNAPAGWTQFAPADSMLFQARDRASGGYETTYMISKLLLTPDSGHNEAISLLTLQRGQDLTAYRVLDQQKISMAGREGIQLTYVYVEANPNVLHTEVPVVVRGEDFIFFQPDGALIITYRAAEENFASGLARFYRFLESVQF